MGKIQMDLHLDLTHKHLSSFVTEGSTVVDGTLGNGHDSELLLKLVGETGSVYAFDLQAEALSSTQRRLSSHPLLDRLNLFQCCHSEMAQHLGGLEVQAGVFNLGYLPGADHQLITKPDTTTKALSALDQFMPIGACLAVVCYRGHEGGEAEYQAVVNWCEAQENWIFMRYERLGRPSAPVAILGEKRG